VDHMEWHQHKHANAYTHTGEAIQNVLEHIFPRSRGGTAQTLVLITDGKANGEIPPGDVAKNASSLGITIIAVGVAAYDYEELLSIAGGDRHKVITVQDYSHLGEILEQTVKLVCEFTDKEEEEEDNEPTPAPTDSMRFQKYGDPNQFPVIVYPLQRNQVHQLANTKAVSLRWLEHDQVKEALSALGPSPTFEAMKTNIWASFSAAFEPTHPDSTPSQPFFTEFSEVVSAQQMRRAGQLTKHVMSVHPLFESEETMETSAQRVRADFPTEFPCLQIQRFLREGLKLDANIFQRSDCTGASPEFVNGAVALSALAGWTVAEVSPAAFASKWFVGRMRPEEVALRVREGSLSVPGASVKSAIDAIFCGQGNSSCQQKAATFTAYEEGSPVHPSWPAMHSAASSLSTWLDVVADLTPQQREEVRLLDYSIAYFRTFAGVHYPSDNRAGLALGQYIVKSKLADHLAVKYACDSASRASIRKYVQDKMGRLPVLDWSVWTPKSWTPPPSILS